MSDSVFTITEHTSPCSYIRQYPHGAKHEDAVLRLAVKEYRPRLAPQTPGEALTIIAAHGNGFPKVCEPELINFELLDSFYGRNASNHYGRTSMAPRTSTFTPSGQQTWPTKAPATL